MMNEETKASLNKFLKEREERIKNMTLAEARDIVSRIYGHSDMRMESDKALQMLLDCADEALEQRWIPVSERLPKENEYIGNVRKYYLIQDEYGDMHVAYLNNVGWIHMDSFKAIHSEVIAWMPLPEPYKEDAE